MLDLAGDTRQRNDAEAFADIMRSKPLETPAAWQLITDVEILKKSGVYDVEKMLTIQLMHAAYYMNNKKMGRDMMHFAEQSKILAREQYKSETPSSDYCSFE
jgi:hypothetical protein